MLRNINSFNSAKAIQDKDLLNKHNYLIDILQQLLRTLQSDEENGITVDSQGKMSLGVATASSPGALSSTDWSTFNGKQDHSNELDALSVLADTEGFIKKTGDATYSLVNVNLNSVWGSNYGHIS